MFTKVVVIFLLLLIPVIALYTYSNQVSVAVVRDAVKTINFNQLSFLGKQMDGQVERLSTNAILYANDPMTQELQYETMSGDTSDRINTIRIIQDHINLQAEISSWNADISLYFRTAQQVVSTLRDVFDFDERDLPSAPTGGWQYVKADAGAEARFNWFAYYPVYAYNRPQEAKIVVRMSFGSGHLQDMLDEYKANGQGDPFLFHPAYGVLTNRTPQADHVGELAAYLQGASLGVSDPALTIRLNGRQYMISYIRSNNLGWYLVDYIPMQDVLAPITKSRNLFYGSTVLLLTICVVASFMLYRNVQVPVRRLVQGVQKIKRGDYSARVKDVGAGDFSFLFSRFNEMTQQIQELVETVHVEQLRSREALLKQLQSQINPHFLYNCLYFIKNVAKLGDREAVVAMALNLGDYFRYTTRLVNQTALLREEIDVIVNYLTIQNLRMERLEFTIAIPEEMNGLAIPRLFLQPIVENAIVHGIEPLEGLGVIAITGMRDEDGLRVAVEDNGVGMSDEALARLQARIASGEEEEGGSTGLWNVDKRLSLMYGPGSGVYVSRSALGGLKVEAVFRLAGEAAVTPAEDGRKEAKPHVPADDRG
ncbi:sensor histidine kinase [Paenibacillus cymbidii]|uniref:sensor histidine kinase n=1 Tax=Paenibacillus cymbidii TaxID=1639034 RepID=UPI001436A43A|nr:sensor histidine kinase [Paenibacillus cymbidii]